MKDKTGKPDAIRESEKIREALYGHDEDFDDVAYAEEFLSSLGHDPTETFYEFKAYLEQSAKIAQAQTGSVPREITETLKTLRSQSNEFLGSNMKPDEWIAGVIEGTIGGRASVQSATLFHGKSEGDLSAGDEKILTDLEDELRKKRD